VLSALSPRARVILLALVGVAGGLLVFGALRKRGGPGDPFDALPRDSFLVATVNVAELRRSPLYEVLFGKDAPAPGSRSQTAVLDPRAIGIGKLADACGFDPLSRVETLALGVPEEGDKGELGVAARVTVTSDELSKCTTNLATQRGGKVETKDIGSFTVIEDSTSQEPARPRLAYGHGGLLVVGRGAWFDAMLAAADGKKPGVREAEQHAAMRMSLTSRDGWRSPTVLISALLPRSLRDRIKNEMGVELSNAVSGGKPEDESQTVMSGVLGVSSVGLALRAGESGGSIDAASELVCDTEGACASVEKLILKKRFDWSKELTLRMVGLGALLDSIEVKREGTRIRVTAGASADNLVSAIDRVLRLKARSRAQDGEPPRSGTKDGDPKRGETIPAPRPSH